MRTGGTTWPKRAAFGAVLALAVGVVTPVATVVPAAAGLPSCGMANVSFWPGEGAAALVEPIDPLDSAGTSATAAPLAPTTIPVWFHVITETAALVQTPDAQLTAQLHVLNQAFTGGVSSPTTPFSFTLAGINHVRNDDWADGFAQASATERTAKSTLRRGDAKTLNIYVTETTGGGSWSTFPWTYAPASSQDGVVLDRGVLPGGTTPGRGEGDIAVHETGHWLGLYHTFHGYDFVERDGGGCVVGDFVADTPAEDRPAEACDVGRDTCPSSAGTDPVHNYMDYSLDLCIDRFTNGQVERMQAQWTTYRDAPPPPSRTKPGKGRTK